MNETCGECKKPNPEFECYECGMYLCSECRKGEKGYCSSCWRD